MIFDELSDYKPSWTCVFHQFIYCTGMFSHTLEYHDGIDRPDEIHFVRRPGHMNNRYEGLLLLGIL